MTSPAIAFALTAAVEAPIVRRLAGVPAVTAIAAVLLINLVSHPPAVLFYRYFGAPLFAVEVAVIVVETALLFALLRTSWVRSLVIAVAANLVTALIGLIA